MSFCPTTQGRFGSLFYVVISSESLLKLHWIYFWLYFSILTPAAAVLLLNPNAFSLQVP